MSAERDSKTTFDNFRHERYFLDLKFDRKRVSNKSPKKLENFAPLLIKKSFYNKVKKDVGFENIQFIYDIACSINLAVLWVETKKFYHTSVEKSTQLQRKDFLYFNPG